MSEIAPILDKLVNVIIVFGAIILSVFMVAFGFVLAMIIRTFKSTREQEQMMRKRRM